MILKNTAWEVILQYYFAYQMFSPVDPETTSSISPADPAVAAASGRPPVVVCHPANAVGHFDARPVCRPATAPGSHATKRRRIVTASGVTNPANSSGKVS
jgi:hypothetical protein